jgi:hypothetical protein
MTATSPHVDVRPQVEVFFSGIKQDLGYLFRRFEFKGMVNSGYIIKCQLFDADYHLLQQLTDGDYFGKPRSEPIEVKFRIKSGPNVTGQEWCTLTRSAIVTDLYAAGQMENRALLEFIAVDKASWSLNTGDAAGSVYKGKISEVIKAVVSKYAPDITLDIGETSDSRENRWYMMRQDPQTFIASLLNWSASVTKDKTHWLIITEDDTTDGTKLTIKEQAAFTSQQRAFYRHYDGLTVSNLRSWEVVANNALSIMHTKIATQGISSVSGRYFDKTTDKDENIVVAKDSTTSNKQIPDVPGGRAFKKPPDGSGGAKNIGWTSVPAIPEIYNGGELGLEYDKYIDSTARTTYLDMLQNLLSVKFRTFGHGEWTDCKGLGVDTIYVKWMGEENVYWLTGNWMVYGFHHIVDRKNWWTDVYAARQDIDASAKQVGQKND